MRSKIRIAAAVAVAALAAPALASDPTQYEVENPAPPIALDGSGFAEAEALNADPTWPHIERAAPTATLRDLGGATVAGAILNDEPVASAVHAGAAPRVVSR